MNKKVLSAILFSALFAGTGTFTSCIDNDEPAGIEELRGAKAELIRAKVAVEQAEASYKLAQAEVQKAEAAFKNAQASVQKALAEHQELLNEREAISNAEAQAELDAKIAQAALDAQKAQLKHEAAMVKLNESLALAKRNYELTLAQIEIAKATLSENAQVTVADLQLAAATAQRAVEAAQADVKDAEENYYYAALDAKKGDVSMKRLEAAVAGAEATLAASNEAYEHFANFLAEETETADWRAEVAGIEATIDSLNKEKVVLALEEAKAQNSDEYLALLAAVTEAEEAVNEAAKALALEEELSYTYKYFAGEQDVKGSVAEGETFKAAVELLAGSEDAPEGTYSTIGAIENEISSYTEEKKAFLDGIAADDVKEGLAKAKKASEDAVAAWKTALTDYNTAVANAKDVTTTAAQNAYKTYKEALAAADLLVGNTAEQTAAKIAAAKVKANQNFADALVAYYNSLPAGQVTFNKLTLPIYTYGKNAAGEIVVTKTTYTTKTVKEWLSDADNKDVYLQQLVDECFKANGFPAYWGVGSEWEVTYTTAAGEEAKYTTAKDAFGKIVKKADYIAAKETALVSKSKAAFGNASNYLENAKYLTVMPTEADAKYVGYENAGKFGAYLGYEDEENVWVAKNYKEIIADLQAAIDYWTAEVEEMNEALTAQEEAVEAAEAAVVAAEEAVETYAEENFTATAAIEALETRIGVLTNVKDALGTAIAAYLNVDFDGTVAFETFLKNEAAKALEAVYAAEEALIDAQNDLAKAKDGKVDVWAELTEAEDELAEAMAELEAAQAELEAALANLSKGLEILAETNAK